MSERHDPETLQAGAETVSAKTLSSITLDDPQSVWIDEHGLSPGYFCLRKPARVDGVLIQQLKDIVAGRGNSNLRLCLHENAEASFHDMIIIEHRDSFYRPHRHPAKGETYHIIEGSQGVLVFDESGEVIDASILEPGGNLVYRVDTNMYHAVMPLSQLVIYHESRPGPFRREVDAIYPSWAPEASQSEEAEAYRARALRALGVI